MKCFGTVQLRISLPFHILHKNTKFKIYESIILPVALNGCKTWSLIPKGSTQMEAFENVLRTPFEPKTEEIKGGWIKVHEKATFFTKYQWYDQIKEDEWDNYKENFTQKI
jgi:hypothetical protein